MLQSRARAFTHKYARTSHTYTHARARDFWDAEPASLWVFLYYNTLQHRYVQGIYTITPLHTADVTVNIGDVSSISREIYCRPTILGSK
jgi:hypothetical protein